MTDTADPASEPLGSHASVASKHSRLPRPLRVLFVSIPLPTESEPGTQTFVRTQMDSLRELGVQIDQFAIAGRRRWKYLRALLRVGPQCRSGRYDLVHAHHGFCALSARGQLQAPLVVSFMGDDLLMEVDPTGRPKPMGRLYRSAYRLLARTAAAVIVKTAEMAAQLPSGNVHVIPNGVDLRMFRPMDRREARQQLGLDPSSVYVLFPASPSRPEKDFHTAERSVDLLRERLTGIRPVELLCLDRVPHSRVPLYMNAADAVLFTSYFEGSPNVIKEALACDRPILSTNVGDVRDLIDGLRGCALVPRRAETICDRLQEALAGDGTAGGGPGRVAHLALEKVARQVLHVYEEVAAAGRKGGRKFDLANPPEGSIGSGR